MANSPVFPSVPIQLYLVNLPVFYQAVNLDPSVIIQIEVWIESEYKKADYSLIYTAEKQTDNEGKVFFRLESVLKAFLQPHLPVLDEIDMAFCKKNIRNYYVRHRLMDPTEPDADFNDGVLHTIMLGGLPLTGIELNTINLRSGLGSAKSFLTNQPDLKKYRPGQYEFLHYLLPLNATGTVTVSLKHYQVDDPSILVTTTGWTLPVTGGEMICFPVFVSPFSLQQYSKIEVTVTFTAGGTEVTSQSRTFLLDYEGYGPDRQFIFVNSWGVLDTLRASGQREESLESKEELAERNLTPTWQKRDGQYFVFNQEISRKLSQSFGYRGAAQHRYLQEFIISPARYEVVNGELLPILAGKFAYKNEIDAQDMHGFSMEYDYAFDFTGYQ